MQSFRQPRGVAQLNRFAARREPFEFRRDFTVIARRARKRFPRQIQPRCQAQFP